MYLMRDEAGRVYLIADAAGRVRAGRVSCI